MSPEKATKLGRYTLISALGSGGMGEVFTALDTRLDRYVAVKVLSSHLADDPTAHARFDREAKAIAGLNHPNVCALFDVGHAKGHDYLVMELLEGATLQTRLQEGPLDLPSLVTYAVALADALDAAHGQGLIHRDLKPGNIFITTRDVPKILDFGLAKTLEAGDPDATRSNETLVTSLGTAVGTLAYMSPEQLRGEAVDTRTDLFSFGLVLYEMATGQQAFGGQTTAVISAGILTKEPTRPRALRPELPARLEDAIQKAMEKDRSRRYQTAAELRADLMRIQREMPAPAPKAVVTRRAAPASPSTVQIEAPSALRPSARRPSSSWARRVLVVILMLAGAAAGGSGGYWWWTHRAHAPTTTAPQNSPAAASHTEAPAPTSVPPAPVTTTLPTPVTSPPADSDASTADAASNMPKAGGGTPGRGRAAGGLIGQGAPLAATLRTLPPQKYHIAFAATAPRARDFAGQLQTVLNAGGWTGSGIQPTQEAAPGPFAIHVPQRTAAADALVDWATRNGFSPDYRVMPELEEIQIVIGAPKER